MSKARAAKLSSTKPSTQRRGSSVQRLTSGLLSRARLSLSRSVLSLPTARTHLLGQRPELDGLAQHRVVAVPLHEVRAAHERAVLGSPAVVVPEVEVDEVNRIRERVAGQQIIFPQPVNDLFGGLHLRVRVG